MTAYEIIFGIILIVLSIAISALVLLQEGNSQGLSGTIAGGAETFFGKNKSNSVEAKLSRLTKVLGVIFFVIALFCTFLLAFMVSR